MSRDDRGAGMGDSRVVNEAEQRGNQNQDSELSVLGYHKDLESAFLPRTKNNMVLSVIKE